MMTAFTNRQGGPPPPWRSTGASPLRKEVVTPPSSAVSSLEQREAFLLAPYAVHSNDSVGRKHPEHEHPFRGPFQRDRDRVLHSSAFRRLSGKMQVFAPDLGDYHRTRLTHTLEVAAVARSLGRALRLNEDLIEALAYFPDIGHPPYGHTGEEALDQRLHDQGGFSHNRYALTIAEELEQRHHSFPGLNLTAEVLECQSHRIDKRSGAAHTPWLEAQLVDQADSMTYDAHDVDDAVKLEFVSLPELQELAIIQRCRRRVDQRYGALEGELLRKAIVHELLDLQTGDLLQNARDMLERYAFQTALEVRRTGFRLRPSSELIEQKAELEEFLYQRVYRHERLVEMRSKAQLALGELHDAYLRKPAWMPERFRLRAELVGLARAAADYIAGMTDRYCQQQHRKRLG